MTATAGPQLDTPPDPAPPRSVDRLRRHSGFALLFLLGGALRLLFMIAYLPAFWFNADSAAYVEIAERPLEPHPTRALGYPVLLKWLAPTESFMSVVLLQHLLGLALAVLVYVFLQRRGVARWVSCIAVTPLLFDSLVVTVEHYLLPDTVFTVLMAAGVLVTMWHPRPGWRAASGSGLLFAAAWFSKPTALPVVLLIALYLLVRRAGWRPLVSYAIAFAVPYIATMIWIGDRQSVYGSQTGIALYGRASIIADCDRIQLTPEQRAICPVQPLGERYDRADAFFWLRPRHMWATVYTPEGAQLLTEFSISVIRQQPADYLRSVGRETAVHFVPGLRLGPMHDCLRERWAPPVQWRDSTPPPERCPPARASADFAAPPAPLEDAPTATPLTRFLHAYGEYVRVIPFVLSLAVLLTLAALARGRIKLDPTVLMLAGPGLTVLTVLIGMYDARYALPALPLAGIAGALAWHGLASRSREESDRGAPPPG